MLQFHSDQLSDQLRAVKGNRPQAPTESLDNIWCMIAKACMCVFVHACPCVYLPN